MGQILAKDIYNRDVLLTLMNSSTFCIRALAVVACTVAGCSVRKEAALADCSCNVATANKRAKDTAPGISEYVPGDCFSVAQIFPLKRESIGQLICN